jgi:predicted patatin/cPLA2 family phospholipase
MSVRSWLLTGDMVGYKFCYDTIPHKLDPFDFKAFAESETEFFAGATNVETGKLEFLSGRSEKEMLANIHASASLPVVSKIVQIGKQKYLDGGIADSIPYELFRKMGYERQVVVLTQPKEYRKQPEKLLPVIRKEYRKYPRFVEACEKRYLVYNETVDRLEKAAAMGELLLIRPSRGIAIKRTEKNPEVVQAQYDLGRRDAEDKLAQVKQYLGQG